jgi:hypothetical protein
MACALVALCVLVVGIVPPILSGLFSAIGDSPRWYGLAFVAGAFGAFFSDHQSRLDGR